MNHLTIDEIIDFVSSSELNDETITLSITVNGHIRKCDECLRKVRAFQMVYDEFFKMSAIGDFKKYFYNTFKIEKNKKFSELEKIIEENERFR